MAYDTSKMPPGLLKEIPSARGNANKQKALKRRLMMDKESKSEDKSKNEEPGLGLPINSKTSNNGADTKGFGAANNKRMK